MQPRDDHDERRRTDPEEHGRPAGNAARDPARQTCRDDMPPDQQQERCEGHGRGSRSPGGVPPRLRVDEEQAVRAKGRTEPLSKDPVDEAREG